MSDLLTDIMGLALQADREPEKEAECISMIQAVIARSRKRKCEECGQWMRRGDKFRKTKTGVEHINCANRNCYCTGVCKHYIHGIGRDSGETSRARRWKKELERATRNRRIAAQAMDRHLTAR